MNNKHLRHCLRSAETFRKEGFFTVTLLRPLNIDKPSQNSSLKPSLKTKDKILFYINQNQKITIVELSQLLHKSRRAIELQIKMLKEKNLIEQVGSDIILSDTAKGSVPDTGGLSADTNGLPADTNGLPADTGLNHEKEIMSYLQQKDFITVKKAMELLGLKESRTREKLKEMTEKNLIEKHGNARSTIYKKPIK
jgi:predicted HTH transcriptional regulator